MAAARVLIIGGGIGGLCAAIALRQRGIEARVFEQADSLREVGAGLTVWTNAVKVLMRLGVAEPVIARASINKRFQLRTWQGDVLDETQPGDLGRRFGTPSIIVHRAELLRELAVAVAPQVVCLAARCVGFEQHPDGVTARFANGSEHHGDILIGADGLHSFVPRSYRATRAQDTQGTLAGGRSPSSKPRHFRRVWLSRPGAEARVSRSTIVVPGAFSGTRPRMRPRAPATDHAAGSKMCSMSFPAGTSQFQRSSRQLKTLGFLETTSSIAIRSGTGAAAVSRCWETRPIR